jgi:hypothetical protein
MTHNSRAKSKSSTLYDIAPPQPAAPTADCRRCGSPIAFRLTPPGRWQPIDPEGEVHFATCTAKQRPQLPDDVCLSCGSLDVARGPGKGHMQGACAVVIVARSGGYGGRTVLSNSGGCAMSATAAPARRRAFLSPPPAVFRRSCRGNPSEWSPVSLA